jgi:hypothetical protein
MFWLTVVFVIDMMKTVYNQTYFEVCSRLKRYMCIFKLGPIVDWKTMDVDYYRGALWIIRDRCRAYCCAFCFLLFFFKKEKKRKKGSTFY